MTIDVRKVDTSNLVRFWHLKNIYCISVTEVVTNFDKSILPNFTQSANIYFINVTEEVSKLFDVINFSNFVHPWNMLCISKTFEVLNIFKFNTVNPEHFLNMNPIYSTLDVSKKLKSIFSNCWHSQNIDSIFFTLFVLKLFRFNINVFKLEQRLNILFIFFTEVVLKLVKSKETSEEQPSNIELALIALSVKKFEGNIIFVKLLQFLNICVKSTATLLLNEDKSKLIKEAQLKNMLSILVIKSVSKLDIIKLCNEKQL